MLDQLEENYLFWRSRKIVETLLAARKKSGEDVTELEEKLTKFIEGSLLGVAEDLQLMQSEKQLGSKKKVGLNIQC